MEQFDASVAKAWEDFHANSANADEDLQETADRAAAELKQDISIAKERWEQANLRAGKEYLQDLNTGRSEELADEAFYKARYASWKTYKAAMATAVNQPEESLNENREFRYDEWDAAESSYHAALQRAERNYRNAAMMSLAARERNNEKENRSNEYPQKAIEWKGNLDICDDMTKLDLQNASED